MQEAEDLLGEELEMTDTVKSNLAATAKWARLLSVTGLIFCLLMLAASFYAGYYISRMMAVRYGFSIAPAISAVYIFFAVVWLFPCFLLYRFSVSLQESIKDNVQEELESAVLNLRSLFKFLGIMILIILLFWLVLFILLVAKTV